MTEVAERSMNVVDGVPTLTITDAKIPTAQNSAASKDMPR